MLAAWTEPVSKAFTIFPFAHVHFAISRIECTIAMKFSLVIKLSFINALVVEAFTTFQSVIVPVANVLCAIR